MIRRNRFEIVGQSLVFAAGVIIAVVFVSIMIIEFENSRRLSDAVNENMIEMTAAVRDSGVLMYDGIRVLGADVLNFGKKHFYSSEGEFVLQITSDSGRTVSVADKHDMEEIVAQSGAEGSRSPVDPSGEYLGKVIKNDNGIITLVSFTQVQ